MSETTTAARAQLRGVTWPPLAATRSANLNRKPERGRVGSKVRTLRISDRTPPCFFPPSVEKIGFSSQPASVDNCRSRPRSECALDSLTRLASATIAASSDDTIRPVRARVRRLNHIANHRPLRRSHLRRLLGHQASMRTSLLATLSTRSAIDLVQAAAGLPKLVMETAA